MLLWFGQATSGLGTAISGVLLPLIAVVYLRADAFAVSALAAAAWAPWLLIGLPAGVWVDRVRCRPLMIGCDLVRAASIASVPIAAAFGLLSIGQLFAVAAIKGFAKVLFQIAYQPYLPSLMDTDDLTEANAKLQGTGAVAAIVGPGVGGILAQLVRAPIAIIADAASYLVSAYSLLRIRSRETARASSERKVWCAIIEGARYVRRDPLLPALTIAPAVANFFFTGFDAIAVVFLVRSVHLSQAAIGLLLTATGLGSVVGAVLARPIGRWIGHREPYGSSP